MTAGSDPGKHSVLASRLLDEAARLREVARDLERTPAPPPPPHFDKSEGFSELWSGAWRKECSLVAERLEDAARTLEDAIGGVSPTHDLVTGRR